MYLHHGSFSKNVFSCLPRLNNRIKGLKNQALNGVLMGYFFDFFSGVIQAQKKTIDGHLLASITTLTVFMRLLTKKSYPFFWDSSCYSLLNRVFMLLVS
jgi:hypothetical protein